MVSSETQLLGSFSIEPEHLIIARQRLPLDNGDYVPFTLRNYPFTMVDPTLTSLRNGAVAISIGRPFGFIQGPLIQETQKTDGIVLALDPASQDRWLATFDTPDPLSDLDLSIFSYGISQYVTYAKRTLERL